MDKKVLSQLKKGARIFLIITVLSITLLLVITVKKETLSSLKQVSVLFLVLTFGACFLRIYFECLRMKTLTWSFGNPISLTTASEFTIGGWFLSLTPFGIGGLPFQIYILLREKFSFGEAGSVIALRGITWLIGFAFGIPMLIGYRSLFAGTGIKILSSYLAGIYLIFVVLFILVMLRTDRVKYRVSQLNKFLLRKNKEKLAEWANKLSDEIEKFKLGFKICWSKGIYKLILTIFLSAVSLFFYVIMVPLLFRGLGIATPIIETAMIQLILTLLLMFAPTPGGAGIAEGAGFASYQSICPNELLGVYVVLWRFFTYHIGVILGGVIIMRMLASKRRPKS